MTDAVLDGLQRLEAGMQFGMGGGGGHRWQGQVLELVGHDFVGLAEAGSSGLVIVGGADLTSDTGGGRVLALCAGRSESLRPIQFAFGLERRGCAR